MRSDHPTALPPATAARAAALFAHDRDESFRTTDRWFVVLMAFQWLGGIAAALWISPRTWSGTTSQVHVHVWTAVPWWRHLRLPDLVALVRPDAPRRATRSQSARRSLCAPHSPDRRPSRPLHVWLARGPRHLPRLTDDPGDHRHRRRPFHPRALLAAVRLRRAQHDQLALDRARRLGRSRALIAACRRRVRDALDGRAPGASKRRIATGEFLATISHDPDTDERHLARRARARHHRRRRSPRFSVRTRACVEPDADPERRSTSKMDAGIAS